MRTWFLILFVLGVAFGTAGCQRADRQIEEIREQNAMLQDRVERLERDIKLLRQAPTLKIETPSSKTTATAVAEVPAFDPKALLKQIETLIAARTEAIIATKVGAMIEEAVVDRVGTAEDIEAVFEDVVEEELAAAEKRREEAREREREERRKAYEARRKEREKQRLDTMAEELSLNDWQRGQLEETETASREKVRALMTEMRESGNFNMTTFREEAEKVRAANNEAIGELLSAEQMELYKKRQDEELSFFNSMGRGRRGGRR